VLYKTVHGPPFSSSTSIVFTFEGGSKMSKRSDQIIETAQSRALKALRLERGVSIRKLAEQVGLSPMRVQQLESGRGNIQAAYIDQFCEVLSVTDKEWEEFLESLVDEKVELRRQCRELVELVQEEQLGILYELIRKFVG
jgi:transcriptional regulator with XRE-family HTH domain